MERGPACLDPCHELSTGQEADLAPVLPALMRWKLAEAAQCAKASACTQGRPHASWTGNNKLARKARFVCSPHPGVPSARLELPEGPGRLWLEHGLLGERGLEGCQRILPWGKRQPKGFRDTLPALGRQWAQWGLEKGCSRFSCSHRPRGVLWAEVRARQLVTSPGPGSTPAWQKQPQGHTDSNSSRDGLVWLCGCQGGAGAKRSARCPSLPWTPPDTL